MLFVTARRPWRSKVSFGRPAATSSSIPAQSVNLAQLRAMTINWPEFSATARGQWPIPRVDPRDQPFA